MTERQSLKEKRERLFRHLRQEIQDERVITAMERVPRERFVPLASQNLAYEDMPLPIGEEQTISQPFIVALMTSALELTGREKVLEIGTGSGYQAAILAELAQLMVSVERYQTLAESAKQTLTSLGYRNIEVHLAGELLGWKEEAPYDGIIVTAGAPQVPQELISQLAEAGRLVIPIGSRYDQQLIKLIKRRGKISTENLGGCRFVPLKGKEAWEDE